MPRQRKIHPNNNTNKSESIIRTRNQNLMDQKEQNNSTKSQNSGEVLGASGSSNLERTIPKPRDRVPTIVIESDDERPEQTIPKPTDRIGTVDMPSDDEAFFSSAKLAKIPKICFVLTEDELDPENVD